MIRFLALAAIVALSSCMRPAFAHEAMSGWAYPASCCSGVDCAEINGAAVQETPGGYVVTVRPGAHPMWRADRPGALVVRVAYAEAKPSPDGHWHLCINGQGELLCFFAAIGGS